MNLALYKNNFYFSSILEDRYASLISPFFCANVLSIIQRKTFSFNISFQKYYLNAVRMFEIFIYNFILNLSHHFIRQVNSHPALQSEVNNKLQLFNSKEISFLCVFPQNKR